MPVAPDLAKTVKVKLDHSENLTRVLGGAKNGKFTLSLHYIKFQIPTALELM